VEHALTSPDSSRRSGAVCVSSLCHRVHFWTRRVSGPARIAVHWTLTASLRCWWLSWRYRLLSF